MAICNIQGSKVLIPANSGQYITTFTAKHSKQYCSAFSTALQEIGNILQGIEIVTVKTLIIAVIAILLYVDTNFMFIYAAVLHALLT